MRTMTPDYSAELDEAQWYIQSVNIGLGVCRSQLFCEDETKRLFNSNQIILGISKKKLLLILFSYDLD
jgi:hypothetical protein